MAWPPCWSTTDVELTPFPLLVFSASPAAASCARTWSRVPAVLGRDLIDRLAGRDILDDRLGALARWDLARRQGRLLSVRIRHHGLAVTGLVGRRHDRDTARQVRLLNDAAVAQVVHMGRRRTTRRGVVGGRDLAALAVADRRSGLVAARIRHGNGIVAAVRMLEFGYGPASRRVSNLDRRDPVFRHGRRRLDVKTGRLQLRKDLIVGQPAFLCDQADALAGRHIGDDRLRPLGRRILPGGKRGLGAIGLGDDGHSMAGPRSGGGDGRAVRKGRLRRDRAVTEFVLGTYCRCARLGVESGRNLDRGFALMTLKIASKFLVERRNGTAWFCGLSLLSMIACRYWSATAGCNCAPVGDSLTDRYLAALASELTGGCPCSGNSLRELRAACSGRDHRLRRRGRRRGRENYSFAVVANQHDPPPLSLKQTRALRTLQQESRSSGAPVSDG